MPTPLHSRSEGYTSAAIADAWAIASTDVANVNAASVVCCETTIDDDGRGVVEWVSRCRFEAGVRFGTQRS